MQEELQYHLALRTGDIGRYVILTGDPDRVPIIAGYLENSKKIAQNREYVTYTGFLGDIKIAIVSTGIGCPSTAICMEELAKVGADTFIRVGTAGGIQEDIKTGEIVISTGCTRDEGTTLQYIPVTYPAVPDFDTTTALIEAARKFNFPHHYGVTHCKDSFYSEVDQGLPMDEEHKKTWAMWKKANILATSMEASAIFIISSLKKLRAGEVVAILGQKYEFDIHDKNAGVNNAIKTAIEAIKILHERDNKA